MGDNPYCICVGEWNQKVKWKSIHVRYNCTLDLFQLKHYNYYPGKA